MLAKARELALRVLTANFSTKLKGPTSQRLQAHKEESQEKFEDFYKAYYPPTAGFYKNGFTEAELKAGNDMVRRAFSLENATPNEIMSYRIDQAVKKYQKHVLDHGTAAVQCAIFSEKIIFLMSHTKRYPRDKKGARTLVRMIQLRRRMLNYCMRVDYQRYKWLCVDYGIPDEPNHGLHKHHWYKNNPTSGY